MTSGLELSHISRRFGSLVALDDVTVHLRPGRVHGLLGENGAGKSTLMNVLYGLLRPDAGVISLDGKPLNLRSPLDAIAAGIGMVHQHFMLAGAMTVLDNVLLGDRRAGRWLDRSAARRKLTDLADRLQLPIDPDARAGDLSVGGQQRVEILKALYREVNLLVLDEPTAVLTPAETAQLMSAVARLRDEGKSVVFISHKLGEVKQVCDDLIVLRRGKVAWHGLAADVTPAELARQMVGRDVALVKLQREPAAHSLSHVPGGEGGGEGPDGRRDIEPGTSQNAEGLSPQPPVPLPAARPSPPPSPPEYRGRGSVLVLDSVTAAGLRDVSLSIAAGEILGIAGVDGNGQRELAEVIVGLRDVKAGRIVMGDVEVTGEPMRRRQERGVAHIPNDRKREGLIGSMSIAQNIALKRHNRRPFSRGGWMNWWNVRRTARRLAERFDVRAGSIDVPVSTLSGGNAQKVILARELALTEPKLIVAMNPVRGLDIAATQFVYQQLLARRAAGCAVLLISSELDELLALSDRIAVLYGGRLTPTALPSQGPAEIGRLMAGI